MGFSVSGSATIVFIGFVVAAGIAVPSFIGSVDELASAQGDRIEQGTETMNTDARINRTIFEDGSPGTLTIEIENTGSTTLSVNDTSVLVDGEIRTSDEITTSVGGDDTAELWLPAETLEITVERDSAPDRVKIVTENGVEEADSDVEVRT